MTFQLIDLKQGTQDWLDFRKQHIGASDAPVIMNESPWKTPYKLWQEKLGLSNSQYTSAAMRRGIDLEERARQKYIEMTGIHVEPAVAKSLEHPFMVASFDGISKDNKSIVEIKCPGEEDHGLAVNNKIPKKYIYQLIQQMLVADANRIHYFSYRSDGDVALVDLSLSDVKEEAKRLITEEKRFWKCLQNFEEPALIDRDYIKMDSQEWAKLMNNFQLSREQRKLFESEEDKYMEQLIAMAEGRNCKGAGFTLTRYMRKGTVEYAKIPEIEGVNLDAYRKKPVECWRII